MHSEIAANDNGTEHFAILSYNVQLCTLKLLFFCAQKTVANDNEHVQIVKVISDVKL